MVNKMIKSKKSKSSKRNTKKLSIKNRHTKSRKSRSNNRGIMRGGDDGRYVLPQSYFGKGTSGYFENGSSQLKSNNGYAVSQGTIWEGGKTAGPNLFPSMSGGNNNCKRKSKKSKKSKNRK